MVSVNNEKPGTSLEKSSKGFCENFLILHQVRAMRLFHLMRTDAERRGFLSEYSAWHHFTKELSYALGRTVHMGF